MVIALTRTPSPHLDRCQLTHRARQPIDIGKAREQHREYEYILTGLQARILHLPDGVFVQDTALVCDELAVTATLGAPSRRDEAASTLMALAPFRESIPLAPPATFDGGDIIIAPARSDWSSHVFVGLTGRTNRSAVEQLRDVMQTELRRYHVRPLRVAGCVHLKSGCSYIGRETFVVNRRWVDANAIEAEGFRCIDVAQEEPFGANTLTVHGTIIVPASCPRTADAIARAGYSVMPVDISEFEKAEAGVSCMSLLVTVIPALMAVTPDRK